jgi:hypothetical protein
MLSDDEDEDVPSAPPFSEISLPRKRRRLVRKINGLPTFHARYQYLVFVFCAECFSP